METLICARTVTSSLFKFFKISNRLLSEVPPKIKLSSTRETSEAKQHRTEQKNRLKFFSSLLGTTIHNANKTIKDYPTLASKPLSDIVQSLQFLEHLGIKKDEVSKNFNVLSLSKCNIRRRHLTLTEIGLSAVGAPELINFTDLMNCSVATLQEQNYLSRDDDQFQNTIQLKCPEDLKKLIYSTCSPYQDLSIGELRKNMMLSYLSYYLKITLYRANLIFQEVHELSCTSVVDLHNVLVFILESLTIDSKTINLDPSLLKASLPDIKELMKTCDIFKLNFKEMVLAVPKLLLCQPENFREICGYLIDFGVAKHQIVKCPQIFLFYSQYIREGLESFSTWPEIHILRCDPRFMDVLMNYKRANVHMFYLKRAGFEQCDVSILISPDESFQRKLSQHKEKDSCKNIINYLSQTLEVSSEEVLSVLRYHPLFTKTNPLTVRNNLSLLLRKKFTKSQILHGLPVTLYSPDRVSQVLKEFPLSPLAQPYAQWRKSSNILQLLLYYIERDEYVHFSPKTVPKLM